MKVLMLSSGSDIRFFENGSAVRERMKQYASLVDELHIIVATPPGFIQEQVDRNLFLYPTNSTSKFFYSRDIFSVASRVKSAIDLVTAQDPFETGLAGLRIARKSGAKLQLQIHTDFLSPYFWRESVKNKARVCIAKHILPKADCIRVVSHRIAKSLYSKLNILASGVTVLPIFVDLKKIQQALADVNLHRQYPEFDFIIFLTSRLEREKNVGVAIEAMRDVIAAYPRTGMIVAGNGQDARALKEKVRRLCLTGHVIFIGWQEHIASALSSADLFLLPSLYEGYGRGVIEAIAMRVPVVMTDVGIAGEIVQNNVSGIIIPVGSVSAIAEACKRLIGDAGFRQEIVKRAYSNFQITTHESYLHHMQQSWENCGKTIN